MAKTKKRDRYITIPDLSDRDMQWLASLVQILQECGMEDGPIHKLLSELCKSFILGQETQAWHLSRTELARIGRTSLPDMAAALVEASRLATDVLKAMETK